MHLKFVPVQTVELCMFHNVWTAILKLCVTTWFNSLTLSNMLQKSSGKYL